jgi:hypothetical protein
MRGRKLAATLIGALAVAACLAAPGPATADQITETSLEIPPGLGLNPEGGATAVWPGRQDGAGSPVEVLAASRPPGGNWDSPARLAPAGDFVFRALKTDLRGNAYALWEQRNDQFETIKSLQLAVRSAGGEWSAPETIASSNPEQGFIGAWQSDLTVAADGTVTAAWCRQLEQDYDTTAGTSITEAATRAPAGGWSAPVVLRRQDIHPCQGSRFEVDLASDQAGNTVANWLELQQRQISNTLPPTTVWAAYRPRGQQWKAPVAVKSHADFEFQQPRVAFERDGDAQLLGPTATYDLWHATLSTDGLASPPVDVPTQVTGGDRTWAEGPSVDLAIDGADTTVVTWAATRRKTDWRSPSLWVNLATTRDAAGNWASAKPFIPESPRPAVGGYHPTFISLYDDAAGNIIAGWTGTELRDFNLGLQYMAYRPSGGAWSEPAVVAPLAVGPPVVATQASFAPTALAATFEPKTLSPFAFASANYPRVGLKARVPRRIGGAAVLRDKGLTVRCRLGRAGYCGVQLLPDQRTEKLIGRLGRSCLGPATKSARVRSGRETKIKFRWVPDPRPHVQCSPFARRILSRRGFDLQFKVIVTGDSVGRAGNAQTKTLTITR